MDVRAFLTEKNRGQAHTVEAILASVLIVLAVLFTLQTTAVTPFSSATTDKHLENQERETVSNAIEIAHSNGGLKQTLLNWETTNTTNYDKDGFAGRENPNETSYYTTMDADTALLSQLSKSIDTSQTAYNVNIVYYNTPTETVSSTLLRSGTPSDNVITVRNPVFLHDTDTLTTDKTVELQEADSSRFYADNLNTSTPTYNYVEVEVVVWRR